MSLLNPTGTKLGRISVLTDLRLSRQKISSLTRTLNTIRQFADVKLLSGNLSEDELIATLEEDSPHLVLLPWYRYLAWSKAEAFYGLTRTSGPTIAGYHFGQLAPHDLGVVENQRTLLLDFAGPSSIDVARAVRTLIQDTRRSGIRPLLDSVPGTPIYFENWTDNQGLGSRIDSVMSIPEIGKTDWAQRSGAIRVVLGALWSLVYEDGPGKSEFAQSLNASQPKAYFQVGANQTFLALRLFYPMPSWCAKDALEYFWPNPERPSAASQLLLRYADFLRIHSVAETSDIEVVAGFYKSAAAERHVNEVHTLWIEPLSANLILEPPYEQPGPNSSYLKPLPVVTPRTVDPNSAAREKMIADLAYQVKELRRIIREKEDYIDELKRGGVGTSKALPVPDAGSLLDAFQDRFFESRRRIREFQGQISALKAMGADPMTSGEMRAMYQQMMALSSQEEEWVKKLAETLRVYAEEKKKVKRAA